MARTKNIGGKAQQKKERKRKRDDKGLVADPKRAKLSDLAKEMFVKLEKKMKKTKLYRFKVHKNNVEKHEAKNSYCCVCKKNDGVLLQCSRSDCTKVYHEKCVGANKCISHMCFECGKEGVVGKELTVVCRYCPVALCKKHHAKEDGFVCDICKKLIGEN